MSSPFVSVPSANAHHGFTPKQTSVGSISMGGPGGINIKPPKPPEKPLVPYMRFSRQMWHKVRDENPDCQLWDIGKKIGALWRELSPQEKHIYQEQWEMDKIEYDKQLKAYHNSAPYQAYLQSKNNPQRSSSSGNSRERDQVRMESGVFIQSVDEDDGEYQTSLRRLAGQRFEKNHRLIGELFSPSNVLDTRTVVTQKRIEMLQRQASSLSNHQKNLENELTDLETRFQNKRKLIQESSEQFAEQLKKACNRKPAIDDAKYEQMIEQAKEKLLLAYKLYKENQAAAEEEEESKDDTNDLETSSQDDGETEDTDEKS